jgi:hypothetical protein
MARFVGHASRGGLAGRPDHTVSLAYPLHEGRRRWALETVREWPASDVGGFG